MMIPQTCPNIESQKWRGKIIEFWRIIRDSVRLPSESSLLDIPRPHECSRLYNGRRSSYRRQLLDEQSAEIHGVLRLMMLLLRVFQLSWRRPTCRLQSSRWMTLKLRRRQWWAGRWDTRLVWTDITTLSVSGRDGRSPIYIIGDGHHHHQCVESVTTVGGGGDVQ